MLRGFAFEVATHPFSGGFTFAEEFGDWVLDGLRRFGLGEQALELKIYALGGFWVEEGRQVGTDVLGGGEDGFGLAHGR